MSCIADDLGIRIMLRPNPFKIIRRMVDNKIWKVEDLAEAAKLPLRSVESALNGKRVRDTTLEKIADALGVTIKELIDK